MKEQAKVKLQTYSSAKANQRLNKSKATNSTFDAKST